MSSTNHTTNYNLSQFVGSDKPAWLADYNSDMGKIDTGMKNNADAISVTDGKADTNATNIGNLANLNTQAKTNIVASVNEIYTTAGTASNTATQASEIANTANTIATTLSRFFTITQNAKIVPSASGATIGTINDVYYALNADGTLGKIYGRIRIQATTAGTITLTLPVSPLDTPSAFTIAAGCGYTKVINGSVTGVGYRDLTVNTNGNVVMTLDNDVVGAQYTIWLPPCLYFFTDFGDIYNPNS